MNTLRDSKSVNSPDPDMSKKDATPQSTRKPKTPLRKDELEKIAKELKMKLSRASAAAKQLSSTSGSATRNLPPELPVLQTSLPRLSPLKNYYMWKRQIAGGVVPGVNSLPSLYLPDRKLPTLTKPLIFLSSSPLKNITEQHKDLYSESGDDEPLDLPTKRRRADLGVVRVHEPQMVLQALPQPLTPPKALNPSPVLTANAARPKQQTTPTLQKKQLHSQNLLLKTPTQPLRGDNYNDEEGADLLMYLATLPSPAKPYATTPRVGAPSSAPANVNKPSAGNAFVAPAPPLTPKRPVTFNARTPQNRMTPSVYGNLAVPGSTLPSAGLALTPAGFNMNDYVNFFTPLPGGAELQNGPLSGRTLLKTPDFHGLVQQTAARAPVDGKMINFDKVEFFGRLGEQQKD